MDDGPADIVFMGGDIFTMDDKNPQAEALAVKGEQILAMGNYADIEPKIKHGHTKIVSLDGKTLLPGFIEAHQHAILLAGARFLYVDIAGYGQDRQLRNQDQVMDIIKTKVSKADPGEWCMFLGWDVELIPTLPELSAEEIEKTFSKEIPIIIMAQSGHSAWVNHKIFEVCNITDATPSPPGGTYVKKDRKLTGQLLEEPAITSIIKMCPKTPGMLIGAIKAVHDQWKDYAAKGFTTVTEMDYHPELVQDLWLSATAHLHDCPIRLALYMNGESKSKPHIIENSKLWVAGVKYWADGSPHAGTAAIEEPYLPINDLTKKLSFPPSPNNCGQLNWSNEELFQKVKVFHDQGRQVAIHSHGERAIQQSLNIYKQLIKPEDDRRHRLEHVGLITEDQLKLCGEIGVTTSIFVDHLYFYGNTFAQYIFGRERTDRWAPLATAIKYLGANNISIHQDHPTFPGPPQPFANMKTAITRSQEIGDPHHTVYGKQYCISVDEALKAYTIGPAHQLFREKEIGSLEVGKYADLVILSTNPYKVDPMKLDTDVQVVETYIGGRCNHIHKGN